MARIETAWHENSQKEHTLLGCASRHPSLREVEDLRGPASFARVVIVTPVSYTHLTLPTTPYV